MTQGQKAIYNAIKEAPAHSAWGKGVKAYALELYEEALKNGEAVPTILALLNGADNWSAYSWGGCSLIYDEDIARRLCTPSELKRTRNGERRPNGREEWLDVQSRALYQAARLVARTAKKTAGELSLIAWEKAGEKIKARSN